MAIGIVVTLVLIAIGMLNRRKNPFFPDPVSNPPRSHHKWRTLRSHHRGRLTPVGMAFHDAIHGRH